MTAMVDLPLALRPVIQTVTPFCPRRRWRSSRVTEPSCHVTFVAFCSATALRSSKLPRDTVVEPGVLRTPAHYAAPCRALLAGLHRDLRRVGDAEEQVPAFFWVPYLIDAAGAHLDGRPLDQRVLTHPHGAVAGGGAEHFQLRRLGLPR